jgi:hypothetical protein
MKQTLFTALVCLGLLGTARAQSFNVDIGTTYGTPSPSYGAAAGSPGVWNEVDMALPIQTLIPLVDLAGNATAVTIEFKEIGSGNYAYPNPGPSGDDALLMNDLCDTGSSTTVIPFVFRGLADGIYHVYAYAWAPDNRAFFATDVELLPGTFPPQPSGTQTWPGGHALGGTYVMERSDVVGGVLRVRFQTGAGFGSANGIQIIGPLADAGTAQAYCTAGVSASGCEAVLSVTGSASSTATSGFVLEAFEVEGKKDGLFFFGSGGQQANPWGNGTSFQCVVPPVARAGLLTGSGTAGQCDGAFAQDLNARWTAKPAQNPGAGALVQAQLWYRDPQNTSNQTTSLSDAIEFTVCP